MSDEERTTEFDRKMDQLNAGLLKAYAAGFAKAVETYEIEDAPNDYQDLVKNDAIRESHYYFWDGRVKPLETWLHEEVPGGDAYEQ